MGGRGEEATSQGKGEVRHLDYNFFQLPACLGEFQTTSSASLKLSLVIFILPRAWHFSFMKGRLKGQILNSCHLKLLLWKDTMSINFRGVCVCVCVWERERERERERVTLKIHQFGLFTKLEIVGKMHTQPGEVYNLWAVFELRGKCTVSIWQLFLQHI
jgi:hypothetical protein